MAAVAVARHPVRAEVVPIVARGGHKSRPCALFGSAGIRRRLLAPVDRAGVDERTTTGERVFEGIGCASCHVPIIETGPNANPLFNRRQVPLFSDLLLHDIGTGDGIAQGAAGPGEVRTPALWGLRFRRPLLHDGSAATVADAVRRHGGEAALARRAIERLRESEWLALLAFLNSL